MRTSALSLFNIGRDTDIHLGDIGDTRWDKPSSALRYRLGQQPFNHNQSNGLLTVIMEDHVDMASVCSITVSTAENQPTQSYKIGDKVSIKIQKSEELFSGELIAIDHSYQGKGTSSIILKCLDHSHRLARGRQTRFWTDMKDSDVVSEVGAESQLGVEVDATT